VWTERRSVAPSPGRRRVPTLLAAVVLLAAAGAGVGAFGLAVVPTDPGSSQPPPPSSRPGPPGSTATQADAPRLWKVRSVIDGMTLTLSNGTRVRLAGVADSCAPIALGNLLVGEWVSLVRGGPDKDARGRLVRYVGLDGLDVGRRLIQKGWARADDEPNPRRAIYERIDQRTPDVCR
jgi:endonuclease YncB( thermonuclease family)